MDIFYVSFSYWLGRKTIEYCSRLLIGKWNSWVEPNQAEIGNAKLRRWASCYQLTTEETLSWFDTDAKWIILLRKKTESIWTRAAVKLSTSQVTVTRSDCSAFPSSNAQLYYRSRGDRNRWWIMFQICGNESGFLVIAGCWTDWNRSCFHLPVVGIGFDHQSNR